MSLHYLYNGDLLIYILGLFSKQKLNTRKGNSRSAINSKELKGKKNPQTKTQNKHTKQNKNNFTKLRKIQEAKRSKRSVYKI